MLSPREWKLYKALATEKLSVLNIALNNCSDKKLRIDIMKRKTELYRGVAKLDVEIHKNSSVMSH